MRFFPGASVIELRFGRYIIINTADIDSVLKSKKEKEFRII